MDEQQQNMNMGMPQQPSGSSSGPIIGVIIILVVVILAGLYFWGQKDMTTETPVTTADTNSITAQSNSDNTDAIENDLNNTDVETVDAEINAS